MARGAAGIEIVGDKELRKALEGLAQSSVNKIMRPAIAAGLAVVKARAKALAPWQSIKRLIGTKVKTKKSKGVVGMVMVNAAKTGRTVRLNGRDVDFSFVAWVLEFGSAKMNIKPQSFMRRARAEAREEALKQVEIKATERLEIEWAKADAKGKLL